METIFQRRQKEKKEHEQLTHLIVTEFLNSTFLKEYYQEELQDTGKDIFEKGDAQGGIGEGRYYKTIRFYITETFYELLTGDFKAIRECKQLYRHIHDTVTTQLREEADSLGDIEDYIPTRIGSYVTIEVDVGEILDDIRQEFADTLTDEECEKFAEDNAPSIKSTA